MSAARLQLVPADRQADAHDANQAAREHFDDLPHGSAQDFEDAYLVAPAHMSDEQICRRNSAHQRGVSLEDVRAGSAEDAVSSVPPEVATKIREIAQRAFTQAMTEALDALKECPGAVLESLTQCLGSALREHADTIEPWG